MYILLEKAREVYRDIDTGAAAGIGIGIGAVLGGVAGVGVPSIVGWEIGDYVQRAMEFGMIASLATKLFGAAVVTTAVGGVTVPAGILGGAFVGGIAGTGAGLAKEGLDKLLEK